MNGGEVEGGHGEVLNGGFMGCLGEKDTLCVGIRGVWSCFPYILESEYLKRVGLSE